MANGQAARAGSISGPPTNDLLALLPQDDYRALVGTLRPIVLQRGHLVQRQGELFERVIFPGGGLYSVRKVMADGRTIELAKIGREGLITPAVLSDSAGVAVAEIVVLVQDGAAMAMADNVFRGHLDRSPTLHELVDSHSRNLVRNIAQIAACSGIHSVEERLCFALLVASDRLRMDEIPLTQDSFARALAVRRPTVSLIMNSLQRAGLIECGRGRIRVVSRKGLMAMSCECYAVLGSEVALSSKVQRFSA